MRYYIVLLVILVFNSCDPGVTHYTKIENQSSYNLKLSSSNIQSFDSLLLAPNNTTTVLETSRIGNANEFSNCPFAADSAMIQCSDTNLTFVGKLEWKFTILREKFTNTETECRAIITNAMLQ